MHLPLLDIDTSRGSWVGQGNKRKKSRKWGKKRWWERAVMRRYVQQGSRKKKTKEQFSFLVALKTSSRNGKVTFELYKIHSLEIHFVKMQKKKVYICCPSSFWAKIIHPGSIVSQSWVSHLLCPHNTAMNWLSPRLATGIDIGVYIGVFLIAPKKYSVFFQQPGSTPRPPHLAPILWHKHTQWGFIVLSPLKKTLSLCSAGCSYLRGCGDEHPMNWRYVLFQRVLLHIIILMKSISQINAGLNWFWQKNHKVGLPELMTRPRLLGVESMAFKMRSDASRVLQYSCTVV